MCHLDYKRVFELDTSFSSGSVSFESVPFICAGSAQRDPPPFSSFLFSSVPGPWILPSKCFRHENQCNLHGVIMTQSGLGSGDRRARQCNENRAHVLSSSITLTIIKMFI